MHKSLLIINKWAFEAHYSLLGQQGATKAAHVNGKLSSLREEPCLFHHKARSHDSPVCVQDVDSILLPEIQQAGMHTELC